MVSSHSWQQHAVRLSLQVEEAQCSRGRSVRRSAAE